MDKSHAMEYLLIGFLSMYIITGSCKMLDIPEKRKKITLNIVDYFENRFYVAASKEPEKKIVKDVQEEKNDNINTNTVSVEERELIDEILREYLG